MPPACDGQIPGTLPWTIPGQPPSRVNGGLRFLGRERVEVLIEPFERLALAIDDPVQLRFADLLENGGEVTSRTQTVADQVMASEQGSGVDWPGRLRFDIVAAVVNLRGFADRGERIGAMKGQ